jgi:signal transduction histidine kinase
MPREQTPMAICVREGLSINGSILVSGQPAGARIVLSVNVAPIIDEDGQRVGAISVFADVSDLKRAEEAVRESATRLLVLSRRVVEVQEKERRHLARELHDEIGQVLSAVSVNLHALKGGRDALAVSQIHESIQMVDLATEQVRNLSLNLRPAMLDDLGLAAAVRWHVDRQARRANFRAHFVVEWLAPILSDDLAIACFRVVQEAVNNVVRHAGARNVWVELRQTDDAIDLSIRDDGIGFDPEAIRWTAVNGGGFGLLSIQERVESLGGRAEIWSQPAGGTHIRASFPFNSSTDAARQDEGTR